jgi:hypothetical protein
MTPSLFDEPHVRAVERPTHGGAVRVARAYVQRVLRASVCRRCCDDRRLIFVHRTVDDDHVPVARLVQVGASRRRIAREMRRCVVLCRRCALALVRPKTLRCHARAPVGMGAPVVTTIRWGRNRILVRHDRASAITRKVE